MTKLNLAIMSLSISQKQLLTMPECAMMLCLTEEALQKRVERKTIPHYKNGGHTYFKRDDVEAEVLSARNRIEPVSETEAHTRRATTRRSLRIASMASR